MRNIFAETLYQCAVEDERIHIVVADISPAGPMAKFQKEYPGRFINVGVAEQVMIGMAAGLALDGKKPFAYTIATFSLYRPFEMVRNDLEVSKFASDRCRNGGRCSLFNFGWNSPYHGRCFDSFVYS